MVLAVLLQIWPDKTKQNNPRKMYFLSFYQYLCAQVHFPLIKVVAIHYSTIRLNRDQNRDFVVDKDYRLEGFGIRHISDFNRLNSMHASFS